MNAKDVGIGLYSFLEFGLCAAVFLPILAVSARRHRNDPTHRIPGRWMRRFGKTATQLSPVWKFEVEGEGPADIDRRGYVVVANHESTADPFLLCHLPWDMRWVAKQELFELPVLGRMMRYGGDVALRRGAKDSIVEMMAECRRTLDAGLSVMMFPEGTRSRDGALLPFKPGAFQLALASGAPILPIAVAGTRDCMRKGARWIGRAHAVARILPVIPTDGLNLADLHAVRDRTRDTIREGVEALRRDLQATR